MERREEELILCPFDVCVSSGDSSAFVTSPTSVFPPSASFTAPTPQSAFPHESSNPQEANGKDDLIGHVVSAVCFKVGVCVCLFFQDSPRSLRPTRRPKSLDRCR